MPQLSVLLAALRSEVNLILNAGKWVLFVGAALMSVAPLYGAELTQPKAVDPLQRIFVGVPNQLTLPPTFPIGASTSPERNAPSKPADDTTPSEATPVGTSDGRIEGTRSTLAASLPLQFRKQISD